MSITITLAKSAGFCFGVKRALDIAFKAAASGKKIEMLGEIVHNEEVVKDIKKAGIKKIQRLSNGKGKILLIRAHGAAAATIAQAKELGYTIIDATCPMVKEIHATARHLEARKYTLIIIGDKNHDEVKGIKGQLKKPAVVIDSSAKDFNPGIKRIRTAAIVVQSTQNTAKVLALVEKLKKYIPELVFSNTICAPTRIKQKEMESLPLQNDCMLIIGSKTSANTKRLYELSKKLNPRTYWVQNSKEIHPQWFKKCATLGITAGASTPERSIQEIIDFINRLSRKSRA